MDTGTAGTGSNFHTGTGHFGNFGTSTHLGKFGTTSIPVPDTSVSSVRRPYRYQEYRYRTEHTLGKMRRFNNSYQGTAVKLFLR